MAADGSIERQPVSVSGRYWVRPPSQISVSRGTLRQSVFVGEWPGATSVDSAEQCANLRVAMAQSLMSIEAFACCAAASPSLRAAEPVLPSPSPVARCRIAADTCCGVTSAAGEFEEAVAGAVGRADEAVAGGGETCFAAEAVGAGGEMRCVDAMVAGETCMGELHP